MTQYLVGGGVAAGLVGVIVALWYKAKYEKAKGKNEALGIELAVARDDVTQARAARDAVMASAADEVTRAKDEITVLRERVKALESNVRKLPDEELRKLGNELGAPKPPKP